jgi:hypothetical protein
MQSLLPIVLEEREKRETLAEELTVEEAKEIPVLRPHLLSTKMGVYRVDQDPVSGAIKVSGKRLEQFTVMTDFSSTGGHLRFRDVLGRIGLLRTLERLKAGREIPIYIGKTRVEQYL